MPAFCFLLSDRPVLSIVFPLRLYLTGCPWASHGGQEGWEDILHAASLSGLLKGAIVGSGTLLRNIPASAQEPVPWRRPLDSAAQTAGVSGM